MLNKKNLMKQLSKSFSTLMLSCFVSISAPGVSSAFEAGAGMSDISGMVQLKMSGFRLNRRTGKLVQSVSLTNVSRQAITGSLHLVFDGLNKGVEVSSKKSSGQAGVAGANSLTFSAKSKGGLLPGEKISFVLDFDKPEKGRIRYKPVIFNSAAY